MDDRIVYSTPSGECHIISPSPNTHLTIDEIQAKDVPVNALNVRQITIADLPQDRVFRDAWKNDPSKTKIGLDVAKAKLIAHEKRRDHRRELLAPLDEERSYITTTHDREHEIDDEKMEIMTANAGVQDKIEKATTEAQLRNALTSL